MSNVLAVARVVVVLLLVLLLLATVGLLSRLEAALLVCCHALSIARIALDSPGFCLQMVCICCPIRQRAGRRAGPVVGRSCEPAFVRTRGRTNRRSHRSSLSGQAGTCEKSTLRRSPGQG